MRGGNAIMRQNCGLSECSLRALWRDEVLALIWIVIRVQPRDPLTIRLAPIHDAAFDSGDASGLKQPRHFPDRQV
jgi:hypothetical protein